MQTQQWRKVKSVFEATAELPAERRDSFLSQHCRNEPEIRRQVEQLLAEHDGSGLLLPSKPPEPALATDSVVSGRFRIARFVGRGGMGEVYEAQDLELGGRVALKTLRPELVAAPQFLSRFRREVNLARQVTHRNICRIFDLGRDGDVAYLTMEFLEGPTLSEILKQRGRLAEEEALTYVLQLAQGLAALHEAQIVHRDLKPANIMIVHSAGRPERLVINDFGLARGPVLESGIRSLSESGQILGTPDYMAPEQLTGEAVTPATDLYALGLVMYEMVTGQKAFAGGEMLENAVQRVTSSPSSPREHVPELGEHWEQVIGRCLSRDPADRPEALDVVSVLDGPRPTLTSPAVDSAPAIAPVSPLLNWRWLIAASFVIVAHLVLFLRLPSRDANAIPAVETRHVAILPFQALGNDPGLAVFGDGLRVTLTEGLSAYESSTEGLLMVPARTVDREGVTNAEQARRKFSVNYVIEGSLQSQDDHVRLHMTLVDTETERQVATARMDGTRSAPLSFQDGALTRLSNLLDLRARPEFVADQPLPSPGAQEFYMQGRGYLQRSDKSENVDLAIMQFQTALDHDPRFAAAHAGLAEAYLYKYQSSKSAEWVEKAQDASTRAIALNDQLPEIHLTLGLLRNATGKYEAAAHDFERALELSPRNGRALEGLGRAYDGMGDDAQAESVFRNAVAVRPQDWAAWKQLGLFYNRSGDDEKAAEAYEQVVALTPDNPHGYVNLGVFYHRLGRRADAKRMWERAVELEPRVFALEGLARLESEGGDHDEAIRYLRQAIEINSLQYGLWDNLGAAYLRTGDTASAAEAYRTAAELVREELKINPDQPTLKARLAHFEVTAGNEAEGRRLLDEVVEQADLDDETYTIIAGTYAQLGEKSAALEALEEALRRGYPKERVSESPPLAGLLSDPAVRSKLERAAGQITRSK
jgi:eukaryotic-like serine/threonine-protein kinase